MFAHTRICANQRATMCMCVCVSFHFVKLCVLYLCALMPITYQKNVYIASNRLIMACNFRHIMTRCTHQIAHTTETHTSIFIYVWIAFLALFCSLIVVVRNIVTHIWLHLGVPTYLANDYFYSYSF